jgi:hypothetical protein
VVIQRWDPFWKLGFNAEQAEHEKILRQFWQKLAENIE